MVLRAKEGPSEFSWTHFVAVSNVYVHFFVYTVQIIYWKLKIKWSCFMDDIVRWLGWFEKLMSVCCWGWNNWIKRKNYQLWMIWRISFRHAIIHCLFTFFMIQCQIFEMSLFCCVLIIKLLSFTFKWAANEFQCEKTCRMMEKWHSDQ